MCQCETDSAHAAGQVRGAGRLHECRVPGRDAPAYAELTDPSAAALCGGPAHWQCGDSGAHERVRRAAPTTQALQVHCQHLYLPDLRWLSPAPVSLVQWLQEVGASQSLHGRVRRSQVHELRRGGARQVPQLLSDPVEDLSTCPPHSLRTTHGVGSS